MYSIKIPKILYLAIKLASLYNKEYYNTNDLAKLSNDYAHQLVRTRKDKDDYKFLEDTKEGGLRGNFSTLLTWNGLLRRGNRIVSVYSIGKNNRIINDASNGKLLLDEKSLVAYTKDEKIKNLIENECFLYNVREGQAHIKVFLEKNKEVLLKRDNFFVKDSVVFQNNRYFLRSLVNNFVDANNSILEYNIINLWSGKKFNQKNIHPLIVIPKKDNNWFKILAIKNEDLIKNMPFLLKIDLNSDFKYCEDENGIKYEMHNIEDAVLNFSEGGDNIEQRLEYKWKDLAEKAVQFNEPEIKEKQEDEFSCFLNKFLQWNKEFTINGKRVISCNVSSSGGPDVTLNFEGGTTQILELEHKWENYLKHGHHKSQAWSNCWIFAEEEWNPDLIVKLFNNAEKLLLESIPKVFLCIENGVRKAYLLDWSKKEFKEISLNF